MDYVLLSVSIIMFVVAVWQAAKKRWDVAVKCQFSSYCAVCAIIAFALGIWILPHRTIAPVVSLFVARIMFAFAVIYGAPIICMCIFRPSKDKAISRHQQERIDTKSNAFEQFRRDTLGDRDECLFFIRDEDPDSAN